MAKQAHEFKKDETVYYITGERVYRGKVLEITKEKNEDGTVGDTHVEAEFYDKKDSFECTFMAFSPEAVFENIFTSKKEAKQYLKIRVSKLIKYTKKQIERQGREIKRLKADLSKYQKRYEKLNKVQTKKK